MGRNIIPFIAGKLGVRIGEEFDVNIPYMGNAKYYRYKLTNEGLLNKRDGDWVPASGFLERLVCGDFEITKLPFEPKDGEEYWTYIGDDDCWEIGCETWVAAPYDYIHKACGCVFRSKEEALAARPIKFKELTGREWQE